MAGVQSDETPAGISSRKQRQQVAILICHIGNPLQRGGVWDAEAGRAAASQIVFSTIALSSAVTSGSIPNHAFHAGRP
jgi:hypothetical protein